MDLTLMFMPSMPILELVIRGTFTFLALFTLIRVVGRRESASVSMGDVLVVVLVADAASTGMNGGSETLGDGFILVLIILFWSVVLDALSYRFAWFRKLAKSGPRPLIKDGKLIRKTMRREFMTEGEVMTTTHGRPFLTPTRTTAGGRRTRGASSSAPANAGELQAGDHGLNPG